MHRKHLKQILKLFINNELEYLDKYEVNELVNKYVDIYLNKF